jgi:DNA polymerase V
MFALVDANSFYCSAEQVFRPDWRGKPIVVLSNNDGCIVAANRQAKEAGIEKFLPYFQVRELCAKRGVIVCSSNYELYADLSSKMMNIHTAFDLASMPAMLARKQYCNFLPLKAL